MDERLYKQQLSFSKLEKTNSLSFPVEEENASKYPKHFIYLKKLQVAPNCKTTTKLKRFTFTHKFVQSISPRILDRIIRNSPAKKEQGSNSKKYLIHNQSVNF